MIKKKLQNMPYAQAYVVIDEHGAKTLVSYTTEVVTIDPLGWLTCTGTYSQTTRKHISYFMREYTNLTYYHAKDAYENNYTINIYSREIQFLGDG